MFYLNLSKITSVAYLSTDGLHLNSYRLVFEMFKFKFSNIVDITQNEIYAHCVMQIV